MIGWKALQKWDVLLVWKSEVMHAQWLKSVVASSAGVHVQHLGKWKQKISINFSHVNFNACSLSEMNREKAENFTLRKIFIPIPFETLFIRDNYWEKYVGKLKYCEFTYFFGASLCKLSRWYSVAACMKICSNDWCSFLLSTLCSHRYENFFRVSHRLLYYYGRLQNIFYLSQWLC